MNSLKYIMMAVVMLSTIACNAQIKNQKTETVHIYGNCGMCKSTIENAGNKKKEAQIEWNKETKMATISYDSLKTNSSEILKRIALSGYDNQLFMAPDDTYANLPGCCQYERPKKEMPEMTKSENKTETMEMDGNMNHANHNMNKNQVEKTQESNPLTQVFNNYFDLKNALVNSDGKTASENAKKLLQEINAVKMEALPMDVHMAWMKVLEPLKEDAEHIADTKDIAHQRDHFMSLSKNMYELIKVSKQEKPVYYQHCPMANKGKGANWLSKENAIKNPYYGSQMLTCGSTVETIK
ncbi:MAG TPA: DUF3347 domain-containing protein [Edaphocola sp.]|nr:DUF3347 domain-containing protein [Edaphocola sp.]